MFIIENGMHLTQINPSRLSNIKLAEIVVLRKEQVQFFPRGVEVHHVSKILEPLIEFILLQATCFDILVRRFKRFGVDPDALEIIRIKAPEKALQICEEVGCDFLSQPQLFRN